MLRLAGPVTMQNAASVLREAAAAVAKGERELSLAALEGSDSSAIALLLALRRAAPDVRFVDAPAGLASFAGVYGLSDILPELGQRAA